VQSPGNVGLLLTLGRLAKWPAVTVAIDAYRDVLRRRRQLSGTGRPVPDAREVNGRLLEEMLRSPSQTAGDPEVEMESVDQPHSLGSNRTAPATGVRRRRIAHSWGALLATRIAIATGVAMLTHVVSSLTTPTFIWNMRHTLFRGCSHDHQSPVPTASGTAAAASVGVLRPFLGDFLALRVAFSFFEAAALSITLTTLRIAECVGQREAWPCAGDDPGTRRLDERIHHVPGRGNRNDVRGRCDYSPRSAAADTSRSCCFPSEL